MKTTMIMKSMALAAMMMMTANMASAATKGNTKNDKAHAGIVVTNKHGHGIATRQAKYTECNCRTCKKLRKDIAKHMRKHHTGKQNKMTCRTCMDYSHKMNTYHNTHRR